MVVAAEHFANFFMNTMPAFCIGMADHYEGPIEAPDWLKIPRRRIPGHAQLSQRLIREVMQTVDTAYAEEWKFDHGIMVPLHFLTPHYDLPIVPANINCQGPPLTPVHRAWAFGEALRRACDRQPERIALVGTGGISHWPATPDSGKINEAWDRAFLARLMRQDREALMAYGDDLETYRDAGQGGFEIRTYLAAAAAARGTVNCSSTARNCRSSPWVAPWPASTSPERPAPYRRNRGSAPRGGTEQVADAVEFGERVECLRELFVGYRMPRRCGPPPAVEDERKRARIDVRHSAPIDHDVACRQGGTEAVTQATVGGEGDRAGQFEPRRGVRHPVVPAAFFSRSSRNRPATPPRTTSMSKVLR